MKTTGTCSNYEWANVADASAADPNRYHGPDEPEPLDGHEFIHLTGPNPWSMVDGWKYHEQQTPCVVCGHVKGGPNLLRASRGRRGLIHCCHCNTASTDGVVAYHGEPVGRRWNDGWEVGKLEGETTDKAEGKSEREAGERPPTEGGVGKPVKFSPKRERRKARQLAES